MSKILSARSAAERIGVCRPTLHRYVRMGLIEAVYVGPRRMIRISEEALHAFLMRNRTPRL